MDKFIYFVLLSALISGIVTEESSVPRKAREEEYGQFVSSTSSSVASDGDSATPAPENILKTQSVSLNPIFNGYSGASRQANSYFGGYQKSTSYGSSSSAEDDGSYKPHLYGGGEYTHDGSGNYGHEDGKYIHVHNPYIHDGKPYVHENNPYIHAGGYIHDGDYKHDGGYIHDGDYKHDGGYIHAGGYIHGQSGYSGGKYADFGKLQQKLGYAADGKYQQNLYGSYNGPNTYAYSAYNYPGYQRENNFFNAYNNSAYQLHVSGQKNDLYSGFPSHPLYNSRYSGYGQYSLGYFPGSLAVTPVKGAAVLQTETSKGASALSGPSTVSDSESSGLSLQQGSLETVDDRTKTSGLTSTSFYSGQSGAVGGIKSAGLSTGQYQTGSYFNQYPGHLNAYQTGKYSPLSVSTYKSYVSPTYSSYSSVLPTSSSSFSSSSSKTLSSGSAVGTAGLTGSVLSTNALKTGSLGHIQSAPGQLAYQSGAYNYGSYQPYKFGDNSAYSQNYGYDYSKYYGGAYPGYSQQEGALKSTLVSQTSSTPGAYGSYKTGSYKTYQYPSVQSTLYQNGGSLGQSALYTSSLNSGSTVSPISSTSLNSGSSSGSSDSSSGVSSVTNRIVNAGAYNLGQNSLYASKVNPVSTLSSSSLSNKAASITSDTSSGISSASNKVLGAGAYQSGAYSLGGNAQLTGSGLYGFSSFGKKVVPSPTPIPLTPAVPLVSSNYNLQDYSYGYHQQPFYGALNDGRQSYYQSGYHSCDSHPGYHGVSHYSASGNLPGYSASSSYPGLYTNQYLRHGLQPLAHDVLLNDPHTVAFSTTVAPLVEVSTEES